MVEVVSQQKKQLPRKGALLDETQQKIKIEMDTKLFKAYPITLFWKSLFPFKHLPSRKPNRPLPAVPISHISTSLKLTWPFSPPTIPSFT